MQATPRGPDPRAELSGYQAKINLLKQIDDAASRFGDTTSKQGGPPKSNKLKELNSLRNADAKRSAQMMMQSGKGGLTGKDLEGMQYGPGGYKHEQSISGIRKHDNQKMDEDLRSLRSEFDYANKKKFTDVLADSQMGGGNGLRGLGALQNQHGKRNLDGQSLRSVGSQNSKTTSFRRRYNSIAINKNGQQVEPIQEDQEENAVVYDKDGNLIELTQEQIELLEHLQDQQNKIDGKQEDILKSMNLEDLKNVDVNQLNALLESAQIPFKSKTIDRTNKKMFTFNYHSNSEEYKNLGNLHKDKRVVEYFPQDDRLEFSTKPQILGKPDQNQGYDFQSGGLAYTQRIPTNLVGDAFRSGRQETDKFNGKMLMDRVSVAESNANSSVSMFPKTTNQDFHGQEVFMKAATLGGDQGNRQNFKKNNVYNAYVNAMFNSGVFTNPWQDQC